MTTAVYTFTFLQSAIKKTIILSKRPLSLDAIFKRDLENVI